MVKRIKDLIDGVYSEKSGKEADKLQHAERRMVEDMSEKDIAREIKRLEKQMVEHAKNLEFEKAAQGPGPVACPQGAGFWCARNGQCGGACLRQGRNYGVDAILRCT